MEMIPNNRIAYYIGLGLWCLTPLPTIFLLYHHHGQSVFLVEETGVPGKNHRPAASH